MGIQGLWPVLESVGQEVQLESLEGKRVAVDVSIWLHQAQLGCPADARAPHVELLLRRLAKLVFYRIRPVFVFDGPQVPRMKRRVLEERRMKRHADDILLTNETKKHLENLASSSQTTEGLGRTLTSLRSPQKKRARREEEAMFLLPATSSQKLSESSGDEADEGNGEEEEGRVEGSVNLDDVIELCAHRELIRKSRLFPEQIPTESVEFSQFQLQRLIGRNQLNLRIDQLKKSSAGGERVVMAVKEGRKRQHLITADVDDECQIINGEEERTSTWSDGKGGDGRILLGLEYLETHSRLHSNQNDQLRQDEDEDFQRAVEESLAECAEKATHERPWMGKATMLEKLASRTLGLPSSSQRFQQDNETRSEKGTESSSDDDFVDVSDIEDEAGDAATHSSWDPAHEEIPGSSGIHSSLPSSSAQNTDGDDTLPAYKDLQELLSAAGFPWVEAPGEAEAQCVFLERAGLVDAVVSDDSDCFAFGVGRLVRHMFSQKKPVQLYESSLIHQLLGLSRWEIVGIAFLSGGDYTVGLRGVGVVSAIEMLAEFASFSPDDHQEMSNRLMAIENWLVKGAVGDEGATQRRLRQSILKLNGRNFIHGLANAEVMKAYANPHVDSSLEQLRWRSVNVDRLKNTLWKFLGWDAEKVDKTVMDAFGRWNAMMAGRSSYQMHMTTFLRPSHPISPEQLELRMTKRLREAIEKLRRKTGQIGGVGETVMTSSSQQEAAGEKASKSCRSKLSVKKGRGKREAARKKKQNNLKSNGLRLSSSSSSDDE